MNLEAIKEQPPGVLDALPIDVLANLQEQAEAHLADASQMVAILHGVFTRRYATGLNDTGTHHRRDGEFDIAITVPKRVEYDRVGLDKAIETIRGWGEDPADYVETKVSVPESKFKAWPPAIRELFESARTVKAGKPTFKISRAKQEAA
jgi:hypothetical protein